MFGFESFLKHLKFFHDTTFLEKKKDNYQNKLLGEIISLTIVYFPIITH